MTDAIDQRSRRTAEDQICQVIGITAHSRLGCKGDASPRRHRFKFISLNLSFYIILSKIPIKTSIKYLSTLVSFLPDYHSFLLYFPTLLSYVATQSPSLSASQFPTLLYISQS